MDRYWEGEHGTVADLDVAGPMPSMLAEYAAYTTDQLIRAYLAGCEPWDMNS